MELNANLHNNECWVYILQHTNQTLTIGIAGNLAQRMEEYQRQNITGNSSHQAMLVYSRQFPDTLSALGFKLVLQQLSKASIMRLIRSNSPTSLIRTE